MRISVRFHAASLVLALGVSAASLAVAPRVLAHGNVTPQPFETGDLPKLGTEWKDKNPYAGNKRAIEVGEFGYKQNCARCHGAELESGGMAPDLHGFPAGADGDEIFIELVKNGKTQNGAEKMPAFFPTVSQEGIWAIRAYIESKHTD